MFYTAALNHRELVVKPIKRWIKQRSVPTQAQMNNLYKPPKFSMESRYAFLLQVRMEAARRPTLAKKRDKQIHYFCRQMKPIGSGE